MTCSWLMSSAPAGTMLSRDRPWMRSASVRERRELSKYESGAALAPATIAKMPTDRRIEEHFSASCPKMGRFITVTGNLGCAHLLCSRLEGVMVYAPG